MYACGVVTPWHPCIKEWVLHTHAVLFYSGRRGVVCTLYTEQSDTNDMLRDSAIKEFYWA